MNSSDLDVIVIGAGQAGLSVGYYLTKLGLSYIIFEKGNIGDSWLNQRWDSFRLNSPNKFNFLPGYRNFFSDDDGFCSSAEYVSYLQEYSRRFQLPVVEGCEVKGVERITGSGGFSAFVSEKGSVKQYRSRQLVLASGAQNKMSIPSFARNVTGEVLQLHACEYRDASLLPEGAVLVVGSAQSGVQIAEDLVGNGKRVFISTSKVSRFPRRYRGKDITDWLVLSGFYDVRTADVQDPQILKMKQPQISNRGLRGHTLSLQGLARKGAVILGKTEGTYNDIVNLRPDAAENVRFADDSSRKIKMMIDDYIKRSHIIAPVPEEDPEDDPDEAALCADSVKSLNLKENKIASVIWATGFTGDFSYLKFPVSGDAGWPKHNEGISDIEGLFIIGHPWLRKRKSGIILGLDEDAGFIAEKLYANHMKKFRLCG
jgi:putative flavoprotein involved in K+ transport